ALDGQRVFVLDLPSRGEAEQLLDEARLELPRLNEQLTELGRPVERAHPYELALSGDRALGGVGLRRPETPRAVVALEPESNRVHLAVATAARRRLTDGFVMIDLAIGGGLWRRFVGFDGRRRLRDVLAHQPRANELAALCGARVAELD